MNLQCRPELAVAYKAGSQIARIVSEDWCARELYCPACDSDHLSRSKVNTPVVDFVCPQCDQPFQLKSLRVWNGKKVVDAGYESMLSAIRTARTPNLLVLQYSPDWLVRNLLLIPRVFFSASVIEKRVPLGPQARRAGWVGCNILLGQIPQDGKITVVSAGSILPEHEVRREFARVRKLAKVPPSLRGWTVGSGSPSSHSKTYTWPNPNLELSILITGMCGPKYVSNCRFSAILGLSNLLVPGTTRCGINWSILSRETQESDLQKRFERKVESANAGL